MAIGKKIGLLKDIIKSDSEINKFILMAAFGDKISLMGQGEDLQDDFYIHISKKTNALKMETLKDSRFKIDLLDYKKDGLKGPQGKPMGFMNTILTLVIDFEKDGFPIYNSEY